MLDKSGISSKIPAEIAQWFDTGFIGEKAKIIMMPQKKSKGNTLSYEQKQENKTISGIRILSEHAINGPKRFRIISDKFRKQLANLDDTFMLITCGLWNYHLRLAR